MSNDARRQQRTPADINGRWFPGQACPSAGREHRDLASGRRGQRFGQSYVKPVMTYRQLALPHRASWHPAIQIPPPDG